MDTSSTQQPIESKIDNESIIPRKKDLKFSIALVLVVLILLAGLVYAISIKDSNSKLGTTIVVTTPTLTPVTTSTLPTITLTDTKTGAITPSITSNPTITSNAVQITMTLKDGSNKQIISVNLSGKEVFQQTQKYLNTNLQSDLPNPIYEISNSTEDYSIIISPGYGNENELLKNVSEVKTTDYPILYRLQKKSYTDVWFYSTDDVLTGRCQGVEGIGAVDPPCGTTAVTKSSTGLYLIVACKTSDQIYLSKCDQVVSSIKKV